jgi:YVTN family beta-propeller protein
MNRCISAFLTIASVAVASVLGNGQSFGQNAYIAKFANNSVSVIDTVSNAVTATINVGGFPFGVAASPDGSKVYVTNEFDGTVSVIDATTNAVTATINVGQLPCGVATNSDGSKVYVANSSDNTVSVIITRTNKVTATIPPTPKSPWLCPWVWQ